MIRIGGTTFQKVLRINYELKHLLTFNLLIRNQYFCEYLVRFFVAVILLILIRLYRRAMAHDENKYQDPHAFKPERFLDADGNLNNDDRILTYGFGRRSVFWYLFEYEL